MRDDIGIADSDVRLSTAPKFAEFEFMMDKELVKAEFVSKDADERLQKRGKIRRKILAATKKRRKMSKQRKRGELRIKLRNWRDVILYAKYLIRS